ncbi:hypothetical protein PSE_4646 [Pseudovibrio sp. FO-BEG1]|nr:hypothetical protein PSE_4646 [Pseudovibrio sp. FO-BEG1]
MVANADGPISPSASAKRFKTELAAKATMTIDVRIKSLMGAQWQQSLMIGKTLRRYWRCFLD